MRNNDTPTIDSRLAPLIHELLVAKIPLDLAKRAFEDKYITAATRMCRGNQTRAAQLLGVHRNTVGNKLRAKKS